ncbi:MAG: hypothetical protein IT567_04370 [Alphaproteobacteria bacterium]|nr:hypothetical protein [Alphaproteobacteria bacterium]
MTNGQMTLDEFLKTYRGVILSPQAALEDCQMTGMKPPLYVWDGDGATYQYDYITGKWNGMADGKREDALLWQASYPEEFASLRAVGENTLKDFDVRLPDEALLAKKIRPEYSGSREGRFSSAGEKDTSVPPMSFYVWGSTLLLGGFFKAVSRTKLGEGAKHTLEKIGDGIRKIGSAVITVSLLEFAFNALTGKTFDPDHHSRVDSFLHSAYTMAKDTVTGHLPGRKQETGLDL